MGYKPSEEKIIHHSSICITYLIKNLVKKTQWDKTMAKGKRVHNVFISPPHVDNHL